VTGQTPTSGRAEGLPLEDVARIQGDVPPDDQDGVLEPDEIERVRSVTRTELDHGEPSPDPTVAGGEVAALDTLDLEDLRDGETDDPIAATEEGIPYVPPIDPPLRADPEEEDGVVMAAGPAVSALSEPYDDSHRADDLTAEPELAHRVREALRADAATTNLVDRLVVGTRGSTVVVRGIVDGIEDTDAIMEVVERVDGVENVVDQTEVAEC
jgi:hypothetical protein